MAHATFSPPGSDHALWQIVYLQSQTDIGMEETITQRGGQCSRIELSLLLVRVVVLGGLFGTISTLVVLFCAERRLQNAKQRDQMLQERNDAPPALLVQGGTPSLELVLFVFKPAAANASGHIASPAASMVEQTRNILQLRVESCPIRQ